MKRTLTALFLVFGLVSASFPALADSCDNALEGVKKSVDKAGPPLSTYFYCILDQKSSCSDEVSDALRAGYDSDTIMLLIEIVSDYRVCKIVND